MDRSVPGRRTVADWDPEPVMPLVLEACERWRIGGQYGSCDVVIVDAAGQRYDFHFKKALSRIFDDSNRMKTGNDVAFVVPGSRLHGMLLEFLGSQRGHAEFGERLGDGLELSEVYVGPPEALRVAIAADEKRRMWKAMGYALVVFGFVAVIATVVGYGMYLARFWGRW